MEVCDPSPSNMSLLDQIFGTDGRKHKDEGIWNWVKNQKNKHKNKGSAVLTRSVTQATPPGSKHNRPESFNSSLSGSASHMSFTCSPTSPTSSFTPSFTRNNHDPSIFTSYPSTITSSSSSSPSSPVTPTESFRAPAPASARTPYLQSRQKTQSTFTLPSQQAMYQHSHQGHGGIAVDGPIKRSTSAKSARTYYSNMSQESLEERRMGGGQKGKRGPLMQRDLMDDISETETSSSIGDATLHSHHSYHTNATIVNQRGGDYMGDDDKSRRSAEMRQAKRDGWWWE